MAQTPARLPALTDQPLIDKAVINKAIAHFPPAMALRRRLARCQLALSGGYTGARIDRAQLSRWLPTPGSSTRLNPFEFRAVSNSLWPAI